ncbi:HGxxPAAW family protein [Gulosibacter bifidus]|uniref:HGxxPAAW family protein n=1 Tax=Gulosibacter bifidus TaxID=272239 RepID=A0ABW5RH59_9MICO|nr:HGxxPAAW family protein [Gulosibacter bifidus]
MSNDNIVYSKYHVEDEGNSVAGWIGVAIIVLGFIVGTIGLFIEVDIVTWVGVAMIPLGAIAWIGLKFAGLGPKGHQ